LLLFHGRLFRDDLAFGAATAIVSEELSAQSDRGPSSDSRRGATRVG